MMELVMQLAAEQRCYYSLVSGSFFAAVFVYFAAVLYYHPPFCPCSE
jgi:hypothetical protein